MFKEENEWLDSEWQCHCGHILKKTKVSETSINSTLTLNIKAWCNNCSKNRMIWIGEEDDN